ncbi:erythromycin esterase family protein [Allostreptomyces psammosilenae]|uniref:Erythromycin esterase-like protein n=1 Tax=Allostreptomyces psammosilenae TaxID=1892865 RepID=A0A852ZPH7_9ACTN|nr:erythromycin esterase family protein [Allostreptomyces psammosilenae]NYI03635.1 erythromycin esterase-like protein [Allostreptomyces psammosilenae]
MTTIGTGPTGRVRPGRPGRPPGRPLGETIEEETAAATALDVRRDVAGLALPLQDADRAAVDRSLDPLLERVGGARFVLLGEASHGTTEYYRWRAALTRRLIEEKGFTVVAVEGDWPDCRDVHRSVTALPGAPEDPGEVLRDFRRWPTWMWANTDVLEFARWLRRHNTALPPERRVGFHGLDVYSLWDSLRAVLDHLRAHDPDRVDTALEAIRCFEPYAEDPRSYAEATTGLVPTSCEAEVVDLLVQLRREVGRPAPRAGGGPGAGGTAADATAADGTVAEREELFDAEQNAAVLVGAERYYRAMMRAGPGSWNIRDHHMADTLDRLVEHYGPRAKAVVWEHNTHVGDARATDMAAGGLVNVGQLVRERHGREQTVIVGFGSHSGEVIAAERWGGRPRVMTVPPAREGTLEDLLHRTVPEPAPGTPPTALFVVPRREVDRPDWMREALEHRAIGVTYRPDRERWGNYVPTVLGDRYDAFCYLDRTHALTPLHPYEPLPGEAETYPYGW